MEDRFGTVGKDGSVRVFDQRCLDQSTIIYEHNLAKNQSKELLKLAWNKYNTNQLAVVPMNSSKVILLDQRQPSQVVSEFCNQQDNSQITSMCWHP
jgi:WD repeat-containing protein 68